MVSTQRPSQAEQVASNAWLWADGGCIFADAANAVTSAAVTAAYAIGIGAAYWLVERTTAFFHNHDRNALAPCLILRRRHVRLWHETDMPTPLRNVRSRGQ